MNKKLIIAIIIDFVFTTFIAISAFLSTQSSHFNGPQRSMFVLIAVLLLILDYKFAKRYHMGS